MEKEIVQTKIEALFRKQVQNDKRVKNAYLLVHSENWGIHLNIAEGITDTFAAHPQQPVHLASVGKLFTATIIGMLHERGDLSFDDQISKYLDVELMNKLHVYKGKDYSGEIKISHLLNQSSGLNDVFYHLWKKLIDTPQIITPREAVIWGKENLKPKSKPGKKHFYTDTNYYLLGLIVENVTKKPFHEILHHFIFEPLEMKHAYMMGFSEPAVKPEHPTAKLFLNGIDATRVKGVSHIDYAGGGVVATLEEYLVFMKALVNHQLVKDQTLRRMLSDDYKSYPTIRYGYAIWKFITIPVILPQQFNCWGCAGVTGAFMFYHPMTESFIIGSFNDMSYKSKALNFMLQKIIRQLLKLT
ncbi:MAG: serine hydrolase domain-containing protein [Bacteroidales bacterium]